MNFCHHCASVIGSNDSEVRCGECLHRFHLHCFRNHGCAEAEELPVLAGFIDEEDM